MKVRAVLLGLVMSLVLSVLCVGLYRRFVLYPDMEERDISGSVLESLYEWEDTLKEKPVEGYLGLEYEYANGNEHKIKFIDFVLNTVKYDVDKEVALNIYGNSMIDSKTNDVVEIDSLLNDDSTVSLSYIDYSKIKIDSETVASMMSDAGLSIGDVWYSSKLVDVFCDYICSIEDVPTLTEKHEFVVDDEDLYLDKVLFSSDSFFELLDEFSTAAGGESLKESDEWVAWNALEDKDDLEEPAKYKEKDLISKSWCGSYYLQNEHYVVDDTGERVKSPVSAEVGDGSFENPAGLNTYIISYVLDGEDKYPIGIRLVEYGVSENAVKWFESKDTRNRGIDVTSEVQYCYYVVEVTNLSDKDLEINDNSSLCDSSANLSSKTGTIYGINSSVTLEPDEKGYIESWGRSTELNKKYLIWGADFSRKQEPVWFRVLAGDIDDPTEEKGVSINNTRRDEE